MDQKEIEEYGHEMAKVELEEFLECSIQAQVKVVGSIKSIFKHQKYIVQVSMKGQVVIRCFKQYNDFDALHELIKVQFQNKDLDDFPSKFQIFNKDQTRKQYFQGFLTSLVKDYYSDRKLLSFVYLFLTKGIQIQKTRIISFKQNPIIQQPVVNLQTDNQHQPLLETPKQTKQIEINEKWQKPQRYSYEQQSNSINNKSSKKNKHRLSMDGEVDSETQLQHLQKPAIDEFWVKFEKDNEWRKRFLKIEGSHLLIFKDKMKNNFRTKVELYRIKVEFLTRDMNLLEHFCQKMEIDIQFTHKQDPTILSLYHQYDAEKVLIRKDASGSEPGETKKELERLKNQLQSASEHLPNSGDFEGVFHPIGKLFIVLNKIQMNWKEIKDQSEVFFIRIRTSVLSYESRRMLYKDLVSIRQGFLIPISNSFDEIIIQCVLQKEGWITKGKEQQVRGQYIIEMADLLTRPSVQVTLKADMQTHKKDTSTTITFTINNFSHFSSIYGDSYANQNDGKIKPNIGKDDTTQLAMTIDRVLRIFGYLALFIQAFWRNVYLFKYPRMGYTFFSWLLVSALVWNSNHTLTVTFIFLMGVILYRFESIGVYLDEILTRYVFVIHPCFKCPQILSKSEVRHLRWSKNLQYIEQDFELKARKHHTIKKLEKKANRQRLLYEFKRHGMIYHVRVDDQSLFQKLVQVKNVLQIVHRVVNTFANTIEKITSLLTWVDRRRTVLILVLLFLLSGVATTLLVRGIVCLFCVHRLVKGYRFYQWKHYRRNRHFAVYAMRYIIKKWYPQLLSPKLDSKDITQEELDKELHKIMLPIHDEKEQRKLKEDCEKIVGVYFDVEGEAERNEKGTYSAGKLVDMIETCESRLKLKWIPGKEGLSNQFQELKEITKQVPVIDVWLESMVVNFILNTPKLSGYCMRKEEKRAKESQHATKQAAMLLEKIRQRKEKERDQKREQAQHSGHNNEEGSVKKDQQDNSKSQQKQEQEYLSAMHTQLKGLTTGSQDKKDKMKMNREQLKVCIMKEIERIRQQLIQEKKSKLMTMQNVEGQKNVIDMTKKMRELAQQSNKWMRQNEKKRREIQTLMNEVEMVENKFREQKKIWKEKQKSSSNQKQDLERQIKRIKKQMQENNSIKVKMEKERDTVVLELQQQRKRNDELKNVIRQKEKDSERQKKIKKEKKNCLKLKVKQNVDEINEKTRQISKLKEEVSESEKTKSEIRKELQVEKRNRIDLERQVRDLQDKGVDIGDLTKRIRQLERSIAKSEEFLKMESSNLLASEAKGRNMESTLTDRENLISQLTEKLERLEADSIMQKSLFETQLTQARKQFEAKNDQISNLEKSLSSVRQELLKVNQETERVETLASERLSEAQGKQKTIEELKSYILQKDQQIASQDTQINDLSTKLQKISSQYDLSKEKGKQLELSAHSLQEENNSLCKKAIELQVLTADMSSRINDKQQKINEKTRQISKLKEEVSESEKTKSEIRKELQVEKRNRIDLERQVRDLQDKGVDIGDLTKRIRQLERSIAKSEEFLKMESSNLLASEAKGRNMESTLTDRENLISQLTEKLERLEADSIMQKSLFETQLTQARKQFEAKNDQISNLEKSLSSVRQELLKVNQETERVETLASERLSEAQGKQKTIEELKSYILQKDQQIASQDTQINDLSTKLQKISSQYDLSKEKGKQLELSAHSLQEENNSLCKKAIELQVLTADMSSRINDKQQKINEKTRQISKLKEEVSESEKTKSEIRKELQVEKRNRIDLERQVRDLQDKGVDIGDLTKRIRQLERSIAKSEEFLKMESSNLLASEAKGRNMESTLTDRENLISQLTEKLERLEADSIMQKSLFETQLTQARKQFEAKNDQISNLEKSLSSVRQELLKVNQETERVETLASERLSEAQGKQKTIEELKSYILQKDQQIASQDTQINDLSTKLQKISSQYDLSKEKGKQLELSAHSLQEENNSLCKKAIELQVLTADMSSRINDKQQKINEKTRQISKLKEEVSESEKTKSEIRKELQVEKRNRIDLERQVRDLQDKGVDIGDLTKRIRQLERSIAKSEEFLKMESSNLLASEAKGRNMESTLTDRENLISQLTEKLERLEADSIMQKSLFETQLTQARKQFEAKNDQISNLEKSLSSVRQELLKVNQETERVETLASERLSEAQGKQKTIEELKSYILQKDQQIASQDTQINDLSTKLQKISSQYDLSKEKGKQLELSAHSLQEENNSLCKKAIELQVLTADMSSRINDKQQKINEKTRQISKLKEEVSESEKTKSEIRKELQVEKRNRIDLERQVRDLQDKGVDIGDLTKRIRQLERSIAKSEEFLKMESSNLLASEAKGRNMESTLTDRENLISQLTEKLERLEADSIMQKSLFETQLTQARKQFEAKNDQISNLEKSLSSVRQELLKVNQETERVETLASERLSEAQGKQKTIEELKSYILQKDQQIASQDTQINDLSTKLQKISSQYDLSKEKGKQLELSAHSLQEENNSLCKKAIELQVLTADMSSRINDKQQKINEKTRQISKLKEEVSESEKTKSEIRKELQVEKRNRIDLERQVRDLQDKGVDIGDLTKRIRQLERSIAKSEEFLKMESSNLLASEAKGRNMESTLTDRENLISQLTEKLERLEADSIMQKSLFETQLTQARKQFEAKNDQISNLEKSLSSVRQELLKVNQETERVETLASERLSEAQGKQKTIEELKSYILQKDQQIASQDTQINDLSTKLQKISSQYDLSKEKGKQLELSAHSLQEENNSLCKKAIELQVLTADMSSRINDKQQKINEKTRQISKLKEEVSESEKTKSEIRKELQVEKRNRIDLERQVRDLQDKGVDIGDLTKRIRQLERSIAKSEEFLKMESSNLLASEAKGRNMESTLTDRENLISQLTEKLERLEADSIMQKSLFETQLTQARKQFEAKNDQISNLEKSLSSVRQELLKVNQETERVETLASERLSEAQGKQKTIEELKSYILQKDQQIASQDTQINDLSTKLQKISSQYDLSKEKGKQLELSAHSLQEENNSLCKKAIELQVLTADMSSRINDKQQKINEKTRQISKLKEEVSESEKTKSEIRKELQVEKRNRIDLERQVRDLQDKGVDIGDLTKRIRQLERSIAKSEEFLKMESSNLLASEAKGRNMESTLTDRENLISQLTEKLERLEADSIMQKSLFETQLTQARKQFEAKNDQISNLEKSLSSVRQELLKVNQETERVETLASERLSEAQGKQKTIEELKSYILQKDQQIASQDTQINDLSTKLQKISSQYDLSKEKGKQLELSAHSLQEENNSLCKKAIELQVLTADMSSRINDKQQKINEKTRQISKLKEEVSESEKTKSEIRKELQVEKRNRIDLERQVRDLQDKGVDIGDLTKRIRQLERSIAKSEEFLKMESSNLLASEAKGRNMESTLTDRENLISQLTEKLERLEADSIMQKSLFETQLTQARKQFEAKNDQISNLEKSLSSVRQELLKVNQETERVETLASERLSEAQGKQKTIEELKSYILQKDQQIASQDTQINDLSTKLQKISSQNAQHSYQVQTLTSKLTQYQFSCTQQMPIENNFRSAQMPPNSQLPLFHQFKLTQLSLSEQINALKQKLQNVDNCNNFAEDTILRLTQQIRILKQNSSSIKEQRELSFQSLSQSADHNNHLSRAILQQNIPQKVIKLRPLAQPDKNQMPEVPKCRQPNKKIISSIEQLTLQLGQAYNKINELSAEVASYRQIQEARQSRQQKSKPPQKGSYFSFFKK